MAGTISRVGNFHEDMIGRHLLDIWRDIPRPVTNEAEGMLRTLAVKEQESHPAVFNGGMADMPLDQFAAVYSGEAGAQGLELGHWTKYLIKGVALDWGRMANDPSYASKVNQIVIDNGMPKPFIRKGIVGMIVGAGGVVKTGACVDVENFVSKACICSGLERGK